MPTASFAGPSGSEPSAGPPSAMSAARTASAPAAPVNADRHPRVAPTASTTVSTSMNSTTAATPEVMNAESAWDVTADAAAGDAWA